MNEKNLGFKELLAIALGGMIGGGIFTVLGIAVSLVGSLAPFAIAFGGLFALLAAYAYVKLGLYYKDEGATYAFYKRTYPTSHLAASFIGWFTIFGYISTLAIYAYTFSAYIMSGFNFEHMEAIRKLVAILVIALFTLINIWSVKGMGEIEDIMVYTKLFILLFISILFISYAKVDYNSFTSLLQNHLHTTPMLSIVIVSSITFVAYEGFELIINAVNEMENPELNIPRAIYSAIILVALIYFILALSAILAIPTGDLIANKESALASGAGKIMGNIGQNIVIVGAILATSSAINGTLFGASRQMARIADDGYLPAILSYRDQMIPKIAIVSIALAASLLIAVGKLRLIVEFGSITFLFVSLLMSIANFKIRKKTNSSLLITLISIFGLSIGTLLILYYEYETNKEQLLFIGVLYITLSFMAWGYAQIQKRIKPPLL